MHEAEWKLVLGVAEAEICQIGELVTIFVVLPAVVKVGWLNIIGKSQMRQYIISQIG